MELKKLSSYLKIKEAATFLGVTAQTLRNWEKKGHIQSYRAGVNTWRLYRQEDLEKILKDIDTSGK